METDKKWRHHFGPKIRKEKNHRRLFIGRQIMLILTTTMKMWTRCILLQSGYRYGVLWMW